MRSNARILVVGAGVAGLACAALLRRAGRDVEIVERSAALRAGGYKIDVRGDAVGVLARLGLEDTARELHCGVRAGSVVTGDGRTVAAMGGDTFGGRSGRDIEIERGDLVGLLAGTAGPLTFGVTPVALTQLDGGVKVTFDDGGTARYAAVIGADGLHSTVRALADIGSVANASAERPLGYAIAVTELASGAGIEKEEVSYVRPGATAMMYATSTRREARAMILLRHEGAVPDDRAGRLAILRAALPDGGWRVPEILEAFATSRSFYMDTMSQVVLPSWHRGRVGLIGDAAACASPSSGQGTTLALLTAYATATLLARRPDAPDLAFSGTHRLLADLVEQNQALGRANIPHMVLPTQRAVTSTLAGLGVLRVLHLENAVVGTVARKLARASRFDLDSVGDDALEDGVFRG